MNLLTGTAHALLSIQINGWRLHHRHFDTAATTENLVCRFHVPHLCQNTAAHFGNASLIGGNLLASLVRFGLAGTPVDTLGQHHLHHLTASLIVVSVTARVFL